MTQEHKHAKIMIAYANNTNLVIESRYNNGSTITRWEIEENPLFYLNMEYRIKPQEKIYTFGDKFIIDGEDYTIVQVSQKKGLLIHDESKNRFFDKFFDLPITLNQLSKYTGCTYIYAN